MQGEKQPLKINYDHLRDILEVDGSKYSGELMRTFASPAPKGLFRFDNDPETGALIIHRVGD